MKPALITIAALVAALATNGFAEEPRVPGPGDFKQGYEDAGYVTRSQTVAAQPGAAADLYAHARSPQPGLPALPVPADNPLSAAKIALGRKLFFDRRLSANNTMSCAMCHVPEHGFAHREMRTAVGIEGQSLRRNTPTIYNSAYLERLFYDGREFSLENQVWSPLLASNEMGNRSIGLVIERIRSLPDYSGLFEASFGTGPGLETVGKALASYERSLVAADSAFDRWRYGNQADALSASARRGFELFVGSGGCAGCHLIGADFALLTDQGFHNTGVGYRATMQPSAAGQIPLAPGQLVQPRSRGLESIGGARPSDLGRYEITGLPQDLWRYRTPSLRNVALTAPYMHDGSIASLEAVVRFYLGGGVPNANLDPLIKPLKLDRQAIADLVAFLNALTGTVTLLVEDARAAPVGS